MIAPRNNRWDIATASFGAWVRARRETLGLTRAQLAEQVGCAVVTIRKIEADERRPSEQVAELLAMHLALPSDAHADFVRVARAEALVARLPAPDGAPPRPIVSQTARAPRVPMLGRSAEMAAAREQLLSEDVSLLTLLGPPGVGKTLLATHLAAALEAAFGDGVTFVALAPISEPQLVISAIAQALGTLEKGAQSSAETVHAFLRQRHMLLVLDNFEQVLAAAPDIADLLEAAPRLKILVTSRASLHLSVEREFPIAPLELPPSGNALEGEQYAAVQLFEQRARSVRPDVPLDGEQAMAVAEICRRLDGLPLAIELAAARSKLFSPTALLARLTNRLQVLTGGMRDLPQRQQTLQAAIAWSYDLLDETEQALFRRLSVFVGGWTLEAAEAIGNWIPGAGDQDVTIIQPLASSLVDRVSSLVDQSLVRTTNGTDGEPRFGMLQTIREFALERLLAHGEREELLQRHALFYLELAERAEPELNGANQIAWNDRLELEHDNLRAALTYCLETPGDPERAELGLRFVSALWLFWQVRSHYTEGTAWLRRALQAAPATPSAARANALNGLGILTYSQYEYDEARERFQQALSMAREIGDRTVLAHSLNNLGTVLVDFRELDEAQRYCEESLQLARDIGLRWMAGWAEMILGRVALERGDLGEAAQRFEASRAEFTAIGSTRGLATALLYGGSVAMEKEDNYLAKQTLAEALELYRVLDDQHGLIYTAADLGRLVAMLGQNEQARFLLSESAAVARQYDDWVGLAWALAGLAVVQYNTGYSAEAEALALEAGALAAGQCDDQAVYAVLGVLAAINASQGRSVEAARLLGASEALRVSNDLRVFSIDRIGAERALEMIRAQLTPAEIDAALAAGRALAPAEVLGIRN